MKKCFFALVLPLALLLTACGREPRPAALLLGQAADLDESETLLVIDGQSIPAWEYLYWLALDCRQMEERCEAAGWKLQCSGTNWQIFYTTDETLELTEEMSDANQFLIQKALVFGWSTRIFYPLIVVLECWLVYQYFQNPG